MRWSIRYRKCPQCQRTVQVVTCAAGRSHICANGHAWTTGGARNG